MSQKILLLHGWGGSDFPHWQSWLAGEIAKDYGCVCFLKFSDFDNPKLKMWLHEAQEALQTFQPDIVICHSLANTLWFHLANTTALHSIKHLYLVAPPSLTCKLDELAEFFPVTPPKKLYAEKVTLITSTNDPYMTSSEAKELAETLHVKHIVLENAGHINAQSGYGQWPWILEEILSLS